MTGSYLTRNRDVPLPEELPPLPDVEEVEGLFYGVPAHRLSLRRTRPRRSPCFDTFIHHFPKFGGPEGVTAAEWAAWVGQPVKVVRRRLCCIALIASFNKSRVIIYSWRNASTGSNMAALRAG